MSRKKLWPSWIAAPGRTIGATCLRERPLTVLSFRAHTLWTGEPAAPYYFHAVNIALHAAATAGHLEIVKYLAMRGANLNRRTRRGVTACLLAYDHDHHDVVAFLETKDIFIKPTATW